MSFFDALRHRWHVLRRGEAYADEQAQEVGFHLDLAAREHSPLDANRLAAERAARRQFGNVTRYREEARETSVLAWLDRTQRNLGFAWRGLQRQPGLAIAVVITLSLGVGLNGAVFTLLDRVFVRPPAGVRSPNELRRLYIRAHIGPRMAPVVGSLPFAWCADFAAVLGGERVAIYSSGDSVAFDTPTGFTIKRSYVSGNFFAVLGVPLRLGGPFTVEELRPWRWRLPQGGVVVISEDLWHRAFGADESIVGRAVHIGGRTVIIAGVAGRRFTGLDLDRVDVWSLLGGSHDAWNGLAVGSSFRFRAVARAPAGLALVPLDSAIKARLRNQNSVGLLGAWSTHDVFDGPIIEAREPLARDAEASAALRVAAATLLVLLIACANVANLLLLRRARRAREIAVRRALGVSRCRLAEQVLVESLLFAVLGGVASLGVAYWGGMLMRRVLFPSIAWSGGVIDLRAIVVIATVAIAAGVFAAIVPAIAGANPDVMTLLRRGPHDGGSRVARVQSMLVIMQTALCVVLLVGATLFIRSLHNAKAIGVGYDPRDMAVGGISFRVGAELFTVLGAVALVVAALGIYGVASYAMTQRTHELGVRLAFGARTEDVFRLAALNGLAELVTATVLGAFIAAALTRFIVSMLWRVRSADAPTLVGTVFVVLVVGTLAQLVPAWRAARIDPVRTLAAD